MRSGLHGGEECGVVGEHGSLYVQLKSPSGGVAADPGENATAGHAPVPPPALAKPTTPQAPGPGTCGRPACGGRRPLARGAEPRLRLCGAIPWDAQRTGVPLHRLEIDYSRQGGLTIPLVRSIRIVVMRMILPRDLRSAIRIPLLLFLVSCSSGPQSHPTGAGGQEASSQGQIKITGTTGSNLIYQPRTEYPKEAMKARLGGVVKLDIAKTKTGQVAAIHILSGEPALVAAAVKAVEDCRYRPTYRNGKPVEIKSRVDVVFTLDE